MTKINLQCRSLHICCKYNKSDYGKAIDYSLSARLPLDVPWLDQWVDVTEVDHSSLSGFRFVKFSSSLRIEVISRLPPIIFFFAKACKIRLLAGKFWSPLSVGCRSLVNFPNISHSRHRLFNLKQYSLQIKTCKSMFGR